MSLNVPTTSNHPHAATSPVYILKSENHDEYIRTAVAVKATYNQFRKLVDPERIPWLMIGNGLEVLFETGTITVDTEVCVATDRNVQQVTQLLTNADSGFSSTHDIEEGSPARHAFTHGSKPRIVLKIYAKTYFSIDSNYVQWGEGSIPFPLMPLYLFRCLKELASTQSAVMMSHLHRLLKNNAFFTEREFKLLLEAMHLDEKQK